MGNQHIWMILGINWIVSSSLLGKLSISTFSSCIFIVVNSLSMHINVNFITVRENKFCILKKLEISPLQKIIMDIYLFWRDFHLFSKLA
jgi:hypothetical protein